MPPRVRLSPRAGCGSPPLCCYARLTQSGRSAAGRSHGRRWCALTHRRGHPDGAKGMLEAGYGPRNALSFKRALDQTATRPCTPALRREQIKLQVGLANALMHVKGYAAPEPKAAFERARLFIERAEALGEPPDDPFLLLSILWGFWSASFVAFNGVAIRELAAQVLALAEKQGLTISLMIAHRLMGMSALHTGDIAEGGCRRETRCDARAEARRCARPCRSGPRWRSAPRQPRYEIR
jgi:hypothetical protein